MWSLLKSNIMQWSNQSWAIYRSMISMNRQSRQRRAGSRMISNSTLTQWKSNIEQWSMMMQMQRESRWLAGNRKSRNNMWSLLKSSIEQWSMMMSMQRESRYLAGSSMKCTYCTIFLRKSNIRRMECLRNSNLHTYLPLLTDWMCEQSDCHYKRMKVLCKSMSIRFYDISTLQDIKMSPFCNRFCTMSSTKGTNNQEFWVYLLYQ